MASSASIVTQKLKESLSLSTRTHDADFAAGVARLGELERDVTLLRKVLQTSNKAICEAAAAAKAQQVTILTELAAKVVGLDGDASVYYDHYKSVHAYMDVELPTKLAAQFETVVLSKLDEWVAALAEVRADLKTAEVRNASTGSLACVQSSANHDAAIDVLAASHPPASRVVTCRGARRRNASCMITTGRRWTR